MSSLHVYLTTWNNSEVLKDTVTWYRQRVPDCKITVYDNQSTDDTVQVCNDLNCEVKVFKSNNEMNEEILVKIRNLCWFDPAHDSKWVIVCDDDEMVDVTQELLDSLDCNVVHCTGYEMFGEDGDTLEDIKYGVPSAGYSKKVMWKRFDIKEMNLAPGSHQANPVAKGGRQIKFNEVPVNLYHTKWARGWTKGVNRQKMIAERVDAESKRKNHNFHFGLPERLEEGQSGLNHWDYYSNGLKNRIKVL